jgi:hypothetical protein
MSKPFTIAGAAASVTRDAARLCVIVAALAIAAPDARAQGRDALMNGALIGAGVGAGVGVAFTHAVRDSDLVFSQYARGALIFGAIGAGVGLGIDALLDRTAGPAVKPRRVLIVPAFWRDVAGVVVKWRW